MDEGKKGQPATIDVECTPVMPKIVGLPKGEPEEDKGE